MRFNTALLRVGGLLEDEIKELSVSHSIALSVDEPEEGEGILRNEGHSLLGHEVQQTRNLIKMKISLWVLIKPRSKRSELRRAFI